MGTRNFYPTYRQREVMQMLLPGEWKTSAQLLPAGERVLGTLVKKCWLEIKADEGRTLYRITGSGRDAFKLVMPLGVPRRND